MSETIKITKEQAKESIIKEPALAGGLWWNYFTDSKNIKTCPVCAVGAVMRDAFYDRLDSYDEKIQDISDYHHKEEALERSADFFHKEVCKSDDISLLSYNHRTEHLLEDITDLFEEITSQVNDPMAQLSSLFEFLYEAYEDRDINETDVKNYLCKFIDQHWPEVIEIEMSDQYIGRYI